MVTKDVLVGKNKGIFEFQNIKSLPPFTVKYEEICDNCIQLDVSGRGAFNFFGIPTDELKDETQVNVNSAVREYADIIEIDVTTIGKYINIYPTNDLNKYYKTYEADIVMSIIYQKSNIGTAYSLRNRSALLVSYILSEIFVLPEPIEDETE